MIKLGTKAKDKITGFEGVVVGHCEYISGCDQYLLQPPVKHESMDFVESKWFDVQRLEATSAAAIMLDNSKTPGFDKEAPKR